MPPFYDIYALSRKRDKETIEKFLAYFTVREMIENREGQDIWSSGNAKRGLGEIEIPIATLTEVIDYGIAHPGQGFAFYISDHLKKVNGIILKFTYDGQIIFGVSVEEKVETSTGALVNNLSGAQELENILAQLTDAHKTTINLEYPPADDEEEFDLDMKEGLK